MQPKFSILLPFRNPGADFKLAIQSVFAQTFTDWELILMDDGSSDGSLEFARSLDDSRVRVISDGRHLHLNVRLNQMVDLARGVYIARTDADDMMHPERLEKQYRLLLQSDAQTVVGTGACAVDIQSHPLGIRLLGRNRKSGFATTASVLHGTIAAPAEWFRKNPYSEDPVYFRSQDAELWFRTAPYTNFVNIDEPLYFVREVGNFSVEKYLWSAFGMLNIAARFGKTSPFKAGLIITARLGKLWVMWIGHYAGIADFLLKRRCIPVNAPQRREAECLIERISATTLPLKRNEVQFEAARSELMVSFE
jgi:glycosyltransferase involved in cell wall biosynthesis